MIFIEHRINTIAQLQSLSQAHGAEIDLRSDPTNGRVILHHDPFVQGESFDEWLAVFRARDIRGPLILNTKEDGLEKIIMDKCLEHDVKNFFFLDTALPTLVKWAIRGGEKRFACRVSAYEPAASLEPFYGKVEWVWVDCFDGVPLDANIIHSLRKHFRVCLVSAELQGTSLTHEFVKKLSGIADAVCTKQPKLWKIA